MLMISEISQVSNSIVIETVFPYLKLYLLAVCAWTDKNLLHNLKVIFHNTEN